MGHRDVLAEQVRDKIIIGLANKAAPTKEFTHRFFGSVLLRTADAELVSGYPIQIGRVTREVAGKPAPDDARFVVNLSNPDYRPTLWVVSTVLGLWTMQTLGEDFANPDAPDLRLVDGMLPVDNTKSASALSRMAGLLGIPPVTSVAEHA